MERAAPPEVVGVRERLIRRPGWGRTIGVATSPGRAAAGFEAAAARGTAGLTVGVADEVPLCGSVGLASVF
jgi:hypothetical protein